MLQYRIRRKLNNSSIAVNCMKTKLLVVGKLKEPHYKEACQEYMKRLKKYCNLEVIEIKDEGKEKEAEKILVKCDDAYSIVLTEEGKHFTSPQFASFIKKRESDIVFIIGGPYGLSDQVKKKANLLLSLSAMTLPHELCRVVFLEQLYRAYTIIKNEKYHH